MALFFNLDYLESVSKGDSVLMVKILDMFNKKKAIPSKYSRVKFNYESMKGKSFLLNPNDLLNDRSTDPGYIAQYIKLAGRRSYALYKLYLYKQLPINLYPDLDISKIRHNPLLTIANNQINFKYEELNNGNRIQEHQG